MFYINAIDLRYPTRDRYIWRDDTTMYFAPDVRGAEAIGREEAIALAVRLCTQNDNIRCIMLDASPLALVQELTPDQLKLLHL